MATLFPDPFDALLQFQQALDSFRTIGWLSTGPSAGGAYPPINIFRKGDDIVAIAEVPGVRKSDLEIQVVGRTIRIAGSKSVEYGDGQPCIAASAWQDALIGPSPCRWKSTPTRLRRNAETGSWRSISRARSETSRR